MVQDPLGVCVTYQLENKKKWADTGGLVLVVEDLAAWLGCKLGSLPMIYLWNLLLRLDQFETVFVS